MAGNFSKDRRRRANGHTTGGPKTILRVVVPAAGVPSARQPFLRIVSYDAPLCLGSPWTAFQRSRACNLRFAFWFISDVNDIRRRRALSIVSFFFFFFFFVLCSTVKGARRARRPSVNAAVLPLNTSIRRFSVRLRAWPRDSNSRVDGTDSYGRPPRQ